MSIRCTCPNGHPLNVNESLAGKAGLCPRCRAPVKVPGLDNPMPGVSEDAILDFLRPQAPIAKIPALAEGAEREAALRTDGHESAAPQKSCFRCNRQISSGTHICPYCHTYIASLQDF